LHSEATFPLDRQLLGSQKFDAPTGCVQSGELSVSPSRWPNAAPFALFLSHDVDQIHDRELFRVLADVNHVRRRWFKGENGNAGLALRRIGRSLLRPKAATRDFETLVQMEAHHGFRSTFFLLHDRYWARHGSRYSFGCREIRDIANIILAAGSEIGLHGGYYRFNNAALYRESLEAVAQHFGVRPCGIRNHLLRFSGAPTWRAQVEAGFAYDATYAWPDRFGPRGGSPLPFFPRDDADQRSLELLELPLTVMDTTLFRHLSLRENRALETAWEAIAKVAESGGLVSLLWHNNYFNEPEYWDWQMVYETLLSRLALLQPWCATGAEINRWWRARAGLVLTAKPLSGAHRRLEVRAWQPINDLVLAVRSHRPLASLSLNHPGARLKRVDGGFDISFANLRAGEVVPLAVGLWPGPSDARQRADLSAPGKTNGSDRL
jgi:hypothetical protein